MVGEWITTNTGGLEYRPEWPPGFVVLVDDGEVGNLAGCSVYTIEHWA